MVMEIRIVIASLEVLVYNGRNKGKLPVYKMKHSNILYLDLGGVYTNIYG